VARLSIADRIHQSAFAVLYPWAARLESLMGRKSDSAAVAVWGHIGSNETPVLAAARELEEEIGLVIAPAEIRFFGCMEQRQTRLSLFECQLAREPEIRIDNREVTAAAFTAPTAISEPTRTLLSYLRARRS
jgi:ADP-ribose pyrophosphatase YjhB (NUDIX family)